MIATESGDATQGEQEAATDAPEETQAHSRQTIPQPFSTKPRKETTAQRADRLQVDCNALQEERSRNEARIAELTAELEKITAERDYAVELAARFQAAGEGAIAEAAEIRERVRAGAEEWRHHKSRRNGEGEGLTESGELFGGMVGDAVAAELRGLGIPLASIPSKAGTGGTKAHGSWIKFAPGHEPPGHQSQEFSTPG